MVWTVGIAPRDVEIGSTRAATNGGLFRTWDCSGKFVYLAKKKRRRTAARDLDKEETLLSPLRTKDESLLSPLQTKDEILVPSQRTEV